jgi:hypothetical protein
MFWRTHCLLFQSQNDDDDDDDDDDNNNNNNNNNTVRLCRQLAQKVVTQIHVSGRVGRTLCRPEGTLYR